MMKKTSITFSLFAVVLSILASNTLNAKELNNITGPGDYNFTMQHGKLTRSYILHVPPAHDGKTALPLVVMLHGGAGNATHALKSTGWNDKADAEGFYVIYPDGTGPLKTWNAGLCCAYAMDNDVDDVGYVRALSELPIPIDGARVYAAGFSNGGMMSHRLACDLADRLAAVAVVGGSMEFKDKCEPAGPIPVIMIHGTDDNNVPYNGGRGKKAMVKLEKRSVDFAYDFWSKADKCEETGVIECEDCEVTTYFSRKCDGGSEVLVYKIIGGAHSWPGGRRVFSLEDKPANSLSATDEIWKFFKAHEKQSD